MTTAQDAFQPTEEEFHGPPITIREGNEVRVQVQPIGHQDHFERRPIGVGFVRGHPHHPQRLRRTGAMMGGAQAPQPDVFGHPRLTGGARQPLRLRDLIGRIFLDPRDEAARERMQVSKQVIIHIPAIEDVKPAGVD